MPKIKSPRRILILSSSTGGGHNARARFLHAWFHHLYPQQVDVKTEQIIEGSSEVGNFGVNMYNKLQTWGLTMALVYLPFWYFLEIFGSLFKWKILLGKKYYEKVIKQFKPHLIISVHDFTNLGYFESARKLLQGNVQCVTICSELSGGFGYSWNWTNPSADLFVSTTQAAQNHAFTRGIQKSKSLIHSTFLSPNEFENKLTPKEVDNYLTQNLHLHPTKFTLLLATGANGANHHIKILNSLRSLFQDINIIAICGKNQKAYRNVINWKLENPSANLKVFNYTQDLNNIIQCSDAIIAKGGANTALIALYHKKPLIFNTMSGLMPQEKATVRFFSERNACATFNSTKELQQIISTWKTKKSPYQNTLKHLSHHSRQDDPKAFIQKLFHHACLPN